MINFDEDFEIKNEWPEEEDDDDEEEENEKIFEDEENLI